MEHLPMAESRLGLIDWSHYLVAVNLSEITLHFQKITPEEM